MCTRETSMSIYMPHMNALQWTMWHRTLVYKQHHWHISLKNMVATGNLFSTALLLYCAYRPHINAHLAQKKENKTKMQLLFTMLYLYVQSHICHIYKFVHVQIWPNFISIYYELPAINNVTRNNGINALHITSICPWTTIHATLYICVPLHVYYILHTHPTLLCISVKMISVSHKPTANQNVTMNTSIHKLQITGICPN